MSPTTAEGSNKPKVPDILPEALRHIGEHIIAQDSPNYTPTEANLWLIEPHGSAPGFVSEYNAANTMVQKNVYPKEIWKITAFAIPADTREKTLAEVHGWCNQNPETFGYHIGSFASKHADKGISSNRKLPKV